MLRKRGLKIAGRSAFYHCVTRTVNKEGARVTDRELMRRYRVLYPEPTQYQRVDFKVLEKKFLENEDGAQELRRRLLERMRDVSR